jgi:hypothetical protein
MLAQKNKKIRKERERQTAEIFTPLSLVNEMLDKLEFYAPENFTDPTKTFIDPACGNGNFLIEILKRKLKHTAPAQAVSTIYGVDIMIENIIECRIRLLKVIKEHIKEVQEEEWIKIIGHLVKNIVHTPLDKYPKGALDYLVLPAEETFQECWTEEMCRTWWYKVVDNKMMDGVNINE